MSSFKIYQREGPKDDEKNNKKKLLHDFVFDLNLSMPHRLEMGNVDLPFTPVPQIIRADRWQTFPSHPCKHACRVAACFLTVPSTILVEAKLVC